MSETQVESAATEARGRRKVLVGRVVSDKMDKSFTVSVERKKRHPKYGRVVTLSTQVMAHDELNDAKEGDLVEVMETRPLSARKRWRLVRIVERKR
ncbi:MAG: 30S ribosomal protein S17 [Fibrobacterota bacterium]|nr:30S ribosomal protein S17 [Fibrobacterota bacterium]QQS06863.1 MAG: 30S ribosomal protein S17 [Fibrobacterota bacterium]